VRLLTAKRFKKDLRLSRRRDKDLDMLWGVVAVCWPRNVWSRAAAFTDFPANGPGPGNVISRRTGRSYGISRTTCWCWRAPEPIATCSADDTSLWSIVRYRYWTPW